MTKPLKEAQRHVHSVLKALSILDCFKIKPKLALKDLAQMTSLKKSGIIRLCGTLQSQGYLTYDSQSGEFRLGHKCFLLGKIYERNNTLRSLALPILQKLGQQAGETASLFVREGAERICLAREEGTYSVRFNIYEGARTALHLGAGGKVLLAYAPPELIQRVLHDNQTETLDLKRLARHRKMEKELAEIRRQGFAISHGERDPDVGAVAAPIYDHTGQVCGTISLAGPMNRFSDERIKEYLPMLLQAAQHLSEMLGYLPDAISEEKRSRHPAA